MRIALFGATGSVGSYLVHPRPFDRTRPAYLNTTPEARTTWHENAA